MDINPSICLVYFFFWVTLVFFGTKKHTLPNLSDLLRFFEDFETFNGGKRGENKQLPRNDHGSTSSTSSPVTWGRIGFSPCPVRLCHLKLHAFFSQQNDLSVSSSFTIYNMYPSKPHHFQPDLFDHLQKGCPFFNTIAVENTIALGHSWPFDTWGISSTWRAEESYSSWFEPRQMRCQLSWAFLYIYNCICESHADVYMQRTGFIQTFTYR